MTTKTDIQKTTSKQPQNVAENGVFCCSTFTGKELDLETGYSYFGARYLDNALSTAWLSVDPMSDKYPSISPYAYCSWNPVKLVDPDGNIILPAPGSSEQFKQQLYNTLSYLSAHGSGEFIGMLSVMPVVIYVQELPFEDAKKGEIKYKSFEKKIYWCPNAGLYTTEGFVLSPATVINHEFDHALQDFINPTQKKEDLTTDVYLYKNQEEFRVITGSEQETAKNLGEISPWQVTRKNHFGAFVWVEDPTSSNRVIPYYLGSPRSNDLKPVLIREKKDE